MNDLLAGRERMNDTQRELYRRVQLFAILHRELTPWQRAYIGRVLVALLRG